MSSSLQTLAPTNHLGTVVKPLPANVPLSVGFRWSFLGWVGYAACQWLIFSVIAKLGNPALVGQFALATAVAGPVFMLTNLQLRGVLSTDARNEYCFTDYVTLRMVGSAFAIGMVALACPFLRLKSAGICVILLVAAFKAMESLSDVIAGLMQKYERLDSAAVALMLRGGCSSIVFASAFAIWRNLPLALALWAGAAGTVIAVYDRRIVRHLALWEGDFTFSFHRERIQALALTSLPLGLVSAVTSLNTNIPRYAIERMLGVSDLGIFASIAYPVTAATIVANSLGQSALARLSRHFAAGRVSDFQRVILKLIAFGFALTALAMTAVALVGNRVLSVLYTPQYAKQGQLFLVLALAAGLNCIACFLVYGLTATRQFKIQIPISVLCMVTTFSASGFLVPRLKLMGAAVALVISACVQIAACSSMLVRAVRQLSRDHGR